MEKNRINLRVPAKVKEWVQENAANQGKTMNGFITDLLIQQLHRLQKKPKSVNYEI